MRSYLIICVVLMFASLSFGQAVEPEFIGEAFILKTDGTSAPLDKEIGDYSSGFSWSANSMNALSLEVAGGMAKSRFGAGSEVQLVVRAVDNNSDPLVIISIYKLKSKSKSRSVLISRDNRGTLLKSRTYSKDLIRFSGRKYGASSYLISLTDLAIGEYGIVVTNPNSNDQKRVVLSCFGID